MISTDSIQYNCSRRIMKITGCILVRWNHLPPSIRSYEVWKHTTLETILIRNNFQPSKSRFRSNSPALPNFPFSSLSPPSSRILRGLRCGHVIYYSRETLIKTIWIILRNEEIEKRKIILRRNASQIMGESNLVCIDLGTDLFKESGVRMRN